MSKGDGWKKTLMNDYHMQLSITNKYEPLFIIFCLFSFVNIKNDTFDEYVTRISRDIYSLIETFSFLLYFSRRQISKQINLSYCRLLIKKGEEKINKFIFFFCVYKKMNSPSFNLLN
jgi:hypothetical protein